MPFTQGQTPSARACIWLVGGTSESAELAQRLTVLSLTYVVTVTTVAAKNLYPPTAQVLVGRMTLADMQQFALRWQVRGILDASHPFASEVSRQAMAVARQQVIAYLRYERPEAASNNDTAKSYVFEQSNATGSVTFIDTIEDLLVDGFFSASAAAAALPRPRHVLFTIGYRELHKVSPLRKSAQLFARILPSEEAIAGALSAGFSSSKIMAMRPPVSPALEAALWQQWQITHVVAKASGAAGGEQTKRAIATQSGVVLILIRRPRLIYPNQTHLISVATEFCSKTLKVY